MNWTSEKVFHDGDSFFKAVLQDIDAAKESIYLEYYIFTEGVLAERLTESICAAAKRGVKVKFCVDGVGSLGFSTTLREKIEAAGVHIKVYHPLTHFSPFSSAFWREIFQLNRRNHRKVCLVDRKILFVGGMNVDDWHLREVKNEEAWRDTGARVTAEDLSALEENLEQIWLPRRLRESRVLQQPVVLNDSRRRRRYSNRDFISRIRNAQHRVWITSPYFSPPGRFLVSLIRCARRGVDTKILLPARPDIFFSRPVNGLFFPVLLSTGVKIYEYMSSTLHAKSVIIDDWVTVGSSNKNYRSFFYDLEIDVILKEKSSLQDLESRFASDLESSREITQEIWNARPWLFRLVEKILWYVRRWT